MVKIPIQQMAFQTIVVDEHVTDVYRFCYVRQPVEINPLLLCGQPGVGRVIVRPRNQFYIGWTLIGIAVKIVLGSSGERLLT